MIWTKTPVYKVWTNKFLWLPKYLYVTYKVHGYPMITNDAPLQKVWLQTVQEYHDGTQYAFRKVGDTWNMADPVPVKVAAPVVVTPVVAPVANTAPVASS